MCPLCSDTGWVQAAPVEDSDGIDYKYVRASRVGTFAPVPCFACETKPRVLPVWEMTA